ncbi:unnamed protein product (macronuclear) [Paramecium tetraurelia]|uniref:PI3K/PI4K catalytic domain-containing protein n=1 Tax=Paramecium tetraurelia TaxID=5888 RepID=A0DUL0_PARTE|nr:uncharacterized protein GSPATT00020399001 [Paramecium tetraurelia]CAK86727.1 unnamed protein product [Paramecium tetraurelia]|eukprot:XP_001454124.1 hypothetical protein (macronuclear) [Paramecium tetraurelia strain d4-2]
MKQSNQKSIDESFRKIICKDVQESTLKEFLERLDQLNYEETSTYLSGLVYIFTRKRWPQLGEYLLKKCAEHIAFYEIIKWSYEAYTYKERQMAENSVAVFDQKIEEAMVNQISENQFLEKESRSNYVNSIHRFVTCLTVLSLHLKNVPLNERQLYLRRNLIKANRALECFRRNNPGIKYCKGIILPFKGRSQMVVRIIDTEAQSFNTKKRVPYKLVVETVDMDEYEQREQQLITLQKPLSVDSQAFLEFDVMHQFDYTVFEDFLQENKDKLARQQILHQDKKRFDQQFPPLKKELIVRRRSCIDQIQSYTNKQLYEKDFKDLFKQEEKLKHSDKELDNITFLDQIANEYPNKKGTIEKIQKQLNDSKNFGQQQVIQQVQSPSQNDLKSGPFSDQQWDDKRQVIQSLSPYGQFNSYCLRSLLIKGGDDLRQEQMMMQIIKVSEDILTQVGLYVKSYDIIITSVDSGILEFCNDTLSMDQLKKTMPSMNLREIYNSIFGDNFEEAQLNFILSLASYSLLQYLFQIKDRHNGNILIDNQGHIIHIDFGFILTIAPGGIKFESAPFKLTKEYIELLDGQESCMFQLFKSKLLLGYLELRKNVDKFAFILEAMKIDNELPCLEKFDMKAFKDLDSNQNLTNNNLRSMYINQLPKVPTIDIQNIMTIFKN